MRVLHIAPDYFYTKLYRLLFHALYGLGVDQRVLVADNEGRAKDTGSPYEVLTYPRRFSSVARLLYFPKQRRLRRFANKMSAHQEVDLCHAHMLFSAGYLAYCYHRETQVPYIVAVRNSDINVFFRYMRPLRGLGVKILSNSQRIILISPAYREQLLAYVPSHLRESVDAKIEVIPNGINPFFLEHSARHQHSTDQLRLVMVGRMMRSKNVQTIIAAADRLVSEGHRVSLSLMGEVEDPLLRPMLQRSYIHLYPASSQEEVLRLLQQTDIFVMPSLAETFGLVYVEAMSQGLPVVYSQGQGIDGYFANGEVGYAVDPHRADAVADAILRIAADYDRLSASAFDRAQQFRWDDIAQRYFDIYSSMLEHGR